MSLDIRRLVIRSVTAAYIGALRLVRVGRRRPTVWPDDGIDVLLTGTFHSDNWARAHIQPLAASLRCRQVRIVTSSPIAAIPKVENIRPAAWSVRLFGSVGARLACFVWLALRTRPQVIGGFHLLFNGMLAALLAPLARAHSLYFCVGGPAEVADGGLLSENRFYARASRPDPVVERWLLAAVAGCDLIVTMGTGAARFYRERGVRARIEVISGGMDDRLYATVETKKDYDAILVARLAPIKRIDLFIRTVGELAASAPGFRAVIVGDGPLRAELEDLAQRIGLNQHLTFAGHQADVVSWLRRTRVFVLTSRSEGLALSLMEAMSCGLPAVVSRVGDLPDLVDDGVNGHLIDGDNPTAFARGIAKVLDGARYAAFATAARSAARRYASSATTRRWDDLLVRPPARE